MFTHPYSENTRRVLTQPFFFENLQLREKTYPLKKMSFIDWKILF